MLDITGGDVQRNATNSLQPCLLCHFLTIRVDIYATEGYTGRVAGTTRTGSEVQRPLGIGGLPSSTVLTLAVGAGPVSADAQAAGRALKQGRGCEPGPREVRAPGPDPARARLCNGYQAALVELGEEGWRLLRASPEQAAHYRAARLVYQVRGREQGLENYTESFPPCPFLRSFSRQKRRYSP